MYIHICSCVLRTRYCRNDKGRIPHVLNKDTHNVASAALDTVGVHMRPTQKHIIYCV